MNNEIIDVDAKGVMGVDAMRDRINSVQKIMKGIMKEDTHYGKIPGTSKPTLYKAGSEVLLTTFMVGIRLEIEDLSDGDQIRYRVKAVGFHQPTNQAIGEGIGECSSNEEKYKWRSAICKEEFEVFPESRKRIKFGKWYEKQAQRWNYTQTQQVRTEPADLANTILKMAKKRAQIDLTLTALGASDMFTQDIEDLPDELREMAADDNSKKKAPKTSPTGISFDQLTESQKAEVKEIGKHIESMFSDDTPKNESLKKSVDFYEKIKIDYKDDENFHIGVWHVLPSQIRSAMKSFATEKQVAK